MMHSLLSFVLLLINKASSSIYELNLSNESRKKIKIIKEAGMGPFFNEHVIIWQHYSRLKNDWLA